MDKTEIALQLTLALLNNEGTGMEENFSFNHPDIEEYIRLKTKLTANIFNDLLSQLKVD